MSDRSEALASYPEPALKAVCGNCTLRELCLPYGLSADDLDRMDGLVTLRRSVARGRSLFRRSDPFEALYSVRSGFFKTCITTEDGRDQVTGFHMAGDLLGLDAIGRERHNCDAIALEDSQVCVVAFSRLERLAREYEPLQRQLHQLMSREIAHDQSMMLLLGGMRAEARIATFLIDLATRLVQRGFSGSAMVLRMTREEIGLYLGMTLETVSRSFSKLQLDGVLEVRQRQIRIIDQDALLRIATPA